MPTNKIPAETLPLERQAVSQSEPGKVRLMKKILAAQMSLSEIKKDKTNEHFKYEYASAATVTAHVRAALHAQGCFLVLHELDETRQTVKSTKFDNKTGAVMEEKESLIVTKRIQATIYDSESGECLSVSFSGDGQDSGDKAPYKAITGTGKYAMLGIMNLASGDDPENEKGGKKQGGGGKPTGDDEEKPHESTATKGTAEDPYYCYSCGKKHIIEGMKIVWQKIDGKNKASVAECYYKAHPKPSAAPASKPGDTAVNGLATEKQIHAIDSYMTNPKRSEDDQAWWVTVKKEYIAKVTAGIAATWISWLNSNPPDAAIPQQEWATMLAGEAQ